MALRQAGITQDATVVLFGRSSRPANDDPFPGSSAGQLAAMRCAHIMLYAGVRDVRVLDGGLQAWVDAGYATTEKASVARPVADFGAPIPGRPELFVDLVRAKEVLASAHENLMCVRSWREFTGEVSGYNYVSKRGRIPGALFGNCGSDAYHMENYRNLDETMREYHEIEELWRQAGITPAVDLETATFAPPPARFEAGTPNIAAAVSLGAAIEFIAGLGRDALAEHGRRVLDHASRALAALDGVTVYGGSTDRCGSLSFNLRGVHPYDAGMILDKLGVAVRTGSHCAQPSMRRLGVDGTIRASVAAYNDRDDIDLLVHGVRQAAAMLL